MRVHEEVCRGSVQSLKSILGCRNYKRAEAVEHLNATVNDGDGGIGEQRSWKGHVGSSFEFGEFNVSLLVSDLVIQGLPKPPGLVCVNWCRVKSFVWNIWKRTR